MELAVLLSREVEARSKLELMLCMIVDGLVVPHAVIMSSLQQLVAEHGEQKWRSGNELEGIVSWLGLFPFSDKPASMLEGISLVVSKIEVGVWRLRGVLCAVRYLPELERTKLPRGLVQQFPHLVDEYDLYLAMPKPGAPTLDFFVDIAAGRYGEGSMERATPYDYPQQIYLGPSQGERDELINRFARAQGNGEKGVHCLFTPGQR